MDLEKSKNLRHVLNKIFDGTSSNRLEEIEQILNKERVFTETDIFVNDLNGSHLKQNLSNAEMLKLEYFKKENLKNLKYVLKQIFVDIPNDRLAEIEKILKKEEIYTGLDLEIADTNELRDNTSLRDIELLNIEEYIKKRNRERYDDIKEVKMAEREKKFARLKMEDQRKFYALKQNEELKFMQLKARGEQTMIEFKLARELLLREEETELMKAKAKVEMERENLNVQIEKELMEARTMDEIKIEDMKLQREKLLMEAKSKEEMEREKINFEREKESREAKVKEESDIKTSEQRKRKLSVAKAKEKKEMREFKTNRKLKINLYDSLMNEKKGLQDDIRGLENECIRLKRVITQNSQKGIIGHFKNDSVELQKAEDEYEFTQKSLKSKNDRITKIDQELRDICGIEM